MQRAGADASAAPITLRRTSVRSPIRVVVAPLGASPVSEKRLQFVPIWNGMTIPDTTPMPNETAKIRVQNAERFAQTALPRQLCPDSFAQTALPRQLCPDSFAGEERQALQRGDVGCEPHGERRQQNVPGDHPDPLQARQEERVERHRSAFRGHGGRSAAWWVSSAHRCHSAHTSALSARADRREVRKPLRSVENSKI